MEVNSCQLSNIVTKSFILDVGKGLDFAKRSKPSNSVQKLFIKETAFNCYYKMIFTTAESNLLLSFKIELFAAVVKGFQL